MFDGQVVNKGETRSSTANPIRKTSSGLQASRRWPAITDEVQDVYRLQGVKINDKHIK